MVKSRKTLNKNKSSGFVLDQTTLGVCLASGFAVIALGLGMYAISTGVFDEPVSATIATEQSTSISTSESSYNDELDSTESSSSDVDREPISESNPVKDAPGTDKEPISESNPVKNASATGVIAPITRDYLIVWGDTLSELAVSNDVPMSALVDLNHIENPDLIYAGDTMKIPN